ncbi:MAG: helix-turn-helix domain-containing protein [Clostridiales bacterium]|jgi:transcriptional regulator with XRE-family HTH domain|nr:helix-turn-helix domain-containing protein [Clostridiales bacterium]
MYEDFFPERLAQLRIKKGVSARDMSLSLGQSENYINMIENKKSFPSMTVFFYICEYLNITPQAFFEIGNENPVKLNEIIVDLKKLDDKSMTHIAEIIKGLANKNI